MSEVPEGTQESEETALYHIYGEADLLLYIGVSNDFGRRWKEHAKQQPWWAERRRMTTVWFDSREDAEDAETAAIKAERPKYNKTHNKGIAVRPAKVAHLIVVRDEQPQRPVQPHVMPNCMYMDELRVLPAQIDLETAGRAHGLGRTLSYELAKADDFPCPVHRRGRYYRVLKAELMTSLGLAMDGTPLSAHASDPAA